VIAAMIKSPVFLNEETHSPERERKKEAQCPSYYVKPIRV